MKKHVREILHRYGGSVVLRPGEYESVTRAFVQPVCRTGEQVPGEMTALGSLDERLWLYLGEAETAEDDRLLWNGTVFRVRSSRPWYVGEELLYWWAVLEQAKEAAV